MKRPLVLTGVLLVALAVLGTYISTQLGDAANHGASSNVSSDAPTPSTTAAIDADLAAAESWYYQSGKDPMITGGVDHFASIVSTNSVNFGFPYSGNQSAVLFVRKNAGTDGYDVFISIDRGQLLGGDQGSITIKMDNDAPMQLPAVLPNDGSSTKLFIGSSPAFFPPFLAHLEHAKTLKVQVTAYQNGNPIFVFNVSGFSLQKLLGTVPSGAPTVAAGAP